MTGDATAGGEPWTLERLDEPGLEHAAGWLALIARPGDVITLTGDLGAGKTTFARAFLRAVAGDPDLEVPSPTFPLVQDYETARFRVLHADLYRLSGPADVTELGVFDDATARVTLVEWPDRAAGLLPPGRIDAMLTDADKGERRTLNLTGHGPAAARLARLSQLVAFATMHGFYAPAAYLIGDASVRAYARLSQAERPDLGPVLLMDSPRAPAGPLLPTGKTYRGTAHHADDVAAFMAIDQALAERQLTVPVIHGADPRHGFLIVEDFGDTGFASILAARAAPLPQLYRTAVDVLLALRQAPPSRVLGAGAAIPGATPATVHDLKPFDLPALEIEASLLADWHWPELHSNSMPGAVREGFVAAFRPALAEVAADTSGWVLRDFHSPNLHWLPQRAGPARIGIIDFQDAMRGSPAYDLASLLQDARVDVPPDLERELLAHYCAAARAAEPGFDEVGFRRAYATLGCQRAVKILGIFVRLWRRDGKPQYLQHLPRIWRLVERNLAAPHLAELRTWFDRWYPVERRGVPGRATGDNQR